jgi:hypothetical protein
MNNNTIILNTISRIFGVLFLAIGVVNTFWGNDRIFGVFIILLSFVYFLPINAILEKTMGFTIPYLGTLKIALALFVLWASLGVGELFDKIDLMMSDLRN